jgi:hypothetical protein
MDSAFFLDFATGAIFKIKIRGRRGKKNFKRRMDDTIPTEKFVQATVTIY